MRAQGHLRGAARGASAPGPDQGRAVGSEPLAPDRDAAFAYADVLDLAACFITAAAGWAHGG